MSKLQYAFMVNDRTYQLDSSDPLPTEGMTGRELTELYNRMAVVAGGIADFDPKGEKTQAVTKFKDKEAGVKRISALHSSVVAFAAGQKAEADREQNERTAKAAAKQAPTAATKKSAEPKKKGRTNLWLARKISLGTVQLAARSKRFATYREGMTVAEYIAEAATQGRSAILAMGDVKYDASKGVISVIGA